MNTRPAPAGHAATPAPGSAHGDAGHGDSEELPNPLKFEPTLSIWTLVVFLGLFLLLRRFAWGPLLDALHKRESHLEKVLQDTEQARNESETLMAEYRKQLARAGDEVRALIEKARADAQAMADQILKQAQEESDAARQRPSGTSPRRAIRRWGDLAEVRRDGRLGRRSRPVQAAHRR